MSARKSRMISMVKSGKVWESPRKVGESLGWVQKSPG